MSQDLYWAYCVLRADATSLPPLTGVDGRTEVERVVAAELAALVSRVPRAEFGEGPLQKNLNDLTWLERVARAHEAVQDQALQVATIVPLRMCTLFESADSVRQMLTRERDSLGTALEQLAGRQEWGAKVLIDPELASRAVRSQSEGDAVEDDGSGAAYMLRRREERELREQADALAANVAELVHGRLGELSLAAVTRPPQNRSLSGHEGSMVLNAAYLVDAGQVDELRTRAKDLNAAYTDIGARVELTGPWPPYNFVPGGSGAAVS